jgi:hypothetical protein
MRDEFLYRLKHSQEPGLPKVDLPERLCPRCGRPIEIRNGQYMAARSRKDKDRSIEICSACGVHEAFQQHTGTDLGAQEWPVDVPDSLRE